MPLTPPSPISEYIDGEFALRSPTKQENVSAVEDLQAMHGLSHASQCPTDFGLSLDVGDRSLCNEIYLVCDTAFLARHGQLWCKCRHLKACNDGISGMSGQTTLVRPSRSFRTMPERAASCDSLAGQQKGTNQSKASLSELFLHLHSLHIPAKLFRHFHMQQLEDLLLD